MSDFFNEALKGGLDSLTADQLDELIIMAQAKRSESKGKKEIKTSDSCPFCGSIMIKKRGIFEKAWSMDEGNINTRLFKGTAGEHQEIQKRNQQ